MSTRQVVGMYMLDRGERAERARAEFARALPDGELGAVGADGTFEVGLPAVDHAAALERVWNALAASGADEHIAFAEHPDVPEHWRRRDDAA
jgi:hypothetical protein